MNLRLLGVAFLSALSLAAQSEATAPKPAAPKAAAEAKPVARDAEAISKEQTAAIALLAERFKAGALTVASVLADPLHMDLHDKTPFRELLKKHAVAAPVTMTSKDEPGTHLRVRGQVVDGERKPVAFALVYAYHTDARGFYGYDRSHISGNAGDFRHARLFAYLRTDADGRFELRTIRPASYPDSDLPQHIHFEVTADGFAANVLENFFAGDPKLGDEQRAEAARNGIPIVALTRHADGSESGDLAIALTRRPK